MFQTTFVEEVSAWSTAVIDRLLPTFGNIEGEANDLSSEHFARFGRRPASTDSVIDLADLAETANEAGLAHYERMQGVRQGMLNLASAGLYHLFEQQAVLFVKKELITPSEENNSDFMTKLLRPGKVMEEFNKRLLAAGINRTALPSFEKLDELRLVANVVKHGGGASGDELVRRRPLLFVVPDLRNDPWSVSRISRPLPKSRKRPPRSVDRPLAGHDLYVTAEEFQAYALVVNGFWVEMADALPS